MSQFPCFGRTSRHRYPLLPAALLGCALAAPAPAAITPVITASRTSGVAPLFVFFDGIATTGLAPNGFLTSGDYVGANFFWDFDSTNENPYGVREKSKGFVNAYVFERPGTYIVKMEVYDRAGAYAQTTTTITVSSFNGTTYYCADNGSDGNPGTISRPFKTFGKAMSCAAPNTRILFRRGDTFTVANTWKAITDGPTIVSSYSDPNHPSSVRPILNCTLANGLATFNVAKKNYWTFTDLHVHGTGDVRFTDNGAFVFGGSHCLFLRVELDNFGTNTFGTDNASDSGIVDCIFYDYGAYGCFSDDSPRLALMGNRHTDIHGYEHVYRIAGGDRTFIAYNTMTSEDSKDCIQVRGSQFNAWNTNSVILENVCNGLVGVNPTNAASDHELENHLLEGNYVWYSADVGGGKQKGMMTGAGRNVVFRNNISHNWTQNFVADAHPASGNPSYIYFYNNTSLCTDGLRSKGFSLLSVEGERVAQNNIHYVNHTIMEAASPCVYSETTNLISDNNLFYAPGYTPAWSIDVLNGANQTLTQAQALGFELHSAATNVPQLVSIDPGHPDFCKLLPASVARNAGATVAVRSDYRSAMRPKEIYYDMGATEYGDSTPEPTPLPIPTPTQTPYPTPTLAPTPTPTSNPTPPPTPNGPTETATFYSIASEDGYLTESEEYTNVGGAMDTGGSGSNSLRLGDDSSDRQRKLIVSFDTSPLPDHAVVVGVTLSMKSGAVTGVNPFTTHGPCYADIKGGDGFGGSTALAISDFEAPADALGGATMLSVAGGGEVSTGILTSGLSHINRTGKTQFRVYFSLDDDDDASADVMGFYSGEAAMPDKPSLVVLYRESAASNSAAPVLLVY